MESLNGLIKSKIDLAAYIAKYSQIDSRGFANCPIHKETKASLRVYPNQSWWCFGCQKGGDIFDFVMAVEGISFTAAKDKLSYMAGIDLKHYKPSEARFNKVNKILHIRAEIKKWEQTIGLASEQIFIGCQLLNQELMVLLNIPWEEVDHKHYTKLHIKHQQWLDYCDQADKVLNLMRKELEKWQTKLAEAKKDG